MDYSKWLAEGMEGKDVKTLARKLKLHPSAIYKMMDGKRKIKADELAVIAEFIGKAIPGQSTGATSNAPALSWNGRVIASIAAEGTVELGTFSIGNMDIRILALTMASK